MWWLLHDSLVASHTNNRHDCIVHDDISKEKMFENQILKCIMSCMNQKASRIAIAYQSCFKYVLSYHAEKKMLKRK